MIEMRKIILITILILAIFLASCKPISTEQKVDDYSESIEEETKETSSQTNEEKEYKEVITTKGKGNSDTESFELNGGKVKLSARTESSIVGSYSSVNLQSENGDDLLNMKLKVKSLSISPEAGEEGYGETIIRDIPSGEYYISVISGIEWEVTVYEYK